ncbi:unnamed protein product [Callosobruchus maculatus]|uniref:Uncharacterized protein n=1 Tax=Callosobruchus maculatus TaxID=64391 RepID=A0A653CF72_CALMS|nr:unnamed protein product [Callosobruchus maculatus]
MSKHGTYSVKNVAKDRSFTFFIGSLTVFLLLLLTVYLVVTYYIGDMKRTQNPVYRKASNSANNAEKAHETMSFFETNKENVTKGSNEASSSGLPSVGFTDPQEEFFDDKFSSEQSSSTTQMNDFTQYTQFNESQGRTEVELTENFKTDSATVKYSKHYKKEYSSKLSTDRDIFSAVSIGSKKGATKAFFKSTTIIPYQGISKGTQKVLDQSLSTRPSSATRQPNLVINQTNLSQTPKSVTNTFVTPQNTQNEGEKHSKRSSSTSTQSILVRDVTEWTQTSNGITSTFSIAKTTPTQRISSEKPNFMHERHSRKPSSASTESTLFRNVTKGNQTPKGVTLRETIPHQSNSTEKQTFLDKMYSKEPQLSLSPNITTFVTLTTSQYRSSTEKQHFLNETHSKIVQSSTTSSESTESIKLNHSQTSPSYRFVISKTTQEPLHLSSVEQKSLTQSNSNVGESKPFIQSEEFNKVKDVSTTKSASFRFVTSQNESVQELTRSSSTKGTTKGYTSLDNPRNMTTVQNSPTSFSNIVELLSVTGSLLPLTESLTSLDKATTHVIVDEELVPENFDLGLLNQLDGAVCDGHICRTAAAKTLYQIDFDSDVCKYPYTYFCGGGKIQKWDFLDIIFKDLISFIKKIDEQSSRYYQVFADSFNMCNKFSPFSVLEHLNKDNAKLPKQYKDLIGELVLTQSIPFFDIDVIPIGNMFQIQISPPGLNIWKTSTFRWSLLNHVKSICLDEVTQWLNTTVDMKLISEDIKICCKKKLMSFMQKYAENRFNNKTQIIQPKILELYSRWIEEYFFETYEDPESNYINVTIKEFCDSEDYYLGLKWRDLFLTIGVSYEPTSIIRIYYPEQVKQVISQAMKNEGEITDILKAWYHIQTYSNMIELLINKNKARCCLELVSELMPDVASVMVQEAVDESMYNDSLSTVKMLFDGLKQTFIKSLPKMFKQRKDLKLFEDELNKVSIMPSSKLTVKDTYDLKMENLFYGNIMELLKHRRKSVFGVLKEKVDVELLLKYFVSPFDSRLHTFLPFKAIVFQPGFLYRAFETEFLPREVYLSKIGFILAVELMKFYIFVEKGQSKINDVSEFGYLIEGEEYLFSSWILPENQMRNNKMAFELIVHHLLEDSKEIEKMSWLNGTFSNSQAFVTSAIQEFCDWSTAADVTKDLYKNQLPAVFRVRSLMLSSTFALESFNCQ